METLWELSASEPDETFTGKAIAAHHPDLAYTTVLTVLDRLARKGLLTQLRDGKVHHFRPMATRASYVAELMHQALAGTPDRTAALVHFAKSVRPNDATVLRGVLDEVEESTQPGAGNS
jgi:predicted transcriptional regulator